MSSSMGRKQLHNICMTGSEGPYRKISREELLLFSQTPELPVSAPTTSSCLRDSIPPTPASTPSSPPSTSPSPALEHHVFAHRGSPDLTCIIPESQTVAKVGRGLYNGVLEKSNSFGQLPASMLPKVGRYPSETSLDSEGRSMGRDHQLQSTSSQDSSDNGEKIKRSSSKIKSLFKKKK